MPRTALISSLLLLMSLTPLAAAASTPSGSWVQEATLTASDANSSSYVGEAGAIDGNTVAVSNGGTEVDVFTKPASGWKSMTQVAILTPSNSDFGLFGTSIAISGNTIVVGAANQTVNSNARQGAVYVYVEPAGGWTNMTETAMLTASDGATGDRLGVSAGISGNTIIAGSANHNDYLGAAYVFVKPSGGWVSGTQTAELTASSDANASEVGATVAISGNTAVAGALLSSGSLGQGGALVFVEPPTGWSDANQIAVLATGELNLSSVESVAINGNTVAAGAPRTTANGTLHAGSVFVWVKPSAGWSNISPTAVLTASDGVKNAYLGGSVGTNGTEIVAGAAYAAVGSNPQQGAAYVFDEPAGGWVSMTESAKITLTNGQNGDLFGDVVGISGGTIVSTAPAINQDEGAAYIFGY